MGDRFLGAWLVSEYVHEPNGRFVGCVRQRRTLQQLENGRIRVIQNCQPDNGLQDHPMGQFGGEWVFELSVAGRERLYHGPDVIGSGQQWLDGIMTGSGLWPNFGYSFRSYACLVTPERQLTGGKFFMAGKPVANIIGLAVPETIENKWPELSLKSTSTQGSLSGELFRFRQTGEQLSAQNVVRSPNTTHGWEETINQLPFFRIRPEEKRDASGLEWNYSGYVAGERPLLGLGRKIGPLLEAELYDDQGGRIGLFNLYDQETDTAVTIRHYFKHDILQEVDVVKLKEDL